MRSVDGENRDRLSLCNCGELLMFRITDEWSEFKSRLLFIVQYKLLGIFVTNISRMSGFVLKRLASKLVLGEKEFYIY